MNVELKKFIRAFDQLDDALKFSHRIKEPYSLGDRYGYIPLDVNMFICILGKAKKHLKKKFATFLDVGAGTGSKLILAHQLFFPSEQIGLFQIDQKVEGIEVDKQLAKIAKATGFKIYEQDALTFKKYGEYDVVYFYRPFLNQKKQQQLEDTIYSQIKKGSIVIPLHCNNNPGKDFKRIDYGIFQRK